MDWTIYRYMICERHTPGWIGVHIGTRKSIPTELLCEYQSRRRYQHRNVADAPAGGHVEKEIELRWYREG